MRAAIRFSIEPDEATPEQLADYLRSAGEAAARSLVMAGNFKAVRFAAVVGVDVDGEPANEPIPHELRRVPLEPVDE